MNDRTAMARFSGIIRPLHFTTPLHRDMAGLLFRCWQETGVVPSADALDVEIRKEIKRRGTRLPAEVATAWLDLLDELARSKVHDAKLITNQVTEWVQDRAFDAMLVELGSIRDLVERTGERDRGRITQIVKEFNAIGVANGHNVVRYFEESRQRMSQLLIDEAEYGLRIPLLLSSIDHLIDGGPLRKDMVVWAAPTSRGKTYALVWVTKASLYQGKKVLFITCEMTKGSIARRVDRCVTHFTRDDMRDDPKLTMERLKALQTYAGELIIIELMGKAATVENIQAELERLNAEEGFQPDVILVDYPGRMHGVQRYQEREKRHELANIYSDLQIIGREYDAVMHVPMQTNKGSFSKPVIGMRDLAECFEVAWMTELMFTLCQTPEEELEDLIRIVIAKNREGIAHFAAPFKFNKKTGNFVRTGEAVQQLDWSGYKREDKEEKDGDTPAPRSASA